MDGLVKFSDYDIFGYLVSGLVVLALYDVALDKHVVVGADWTVSHTAFVIIASYVLGHVTAAFSTPIFDRFLVRKLIGRPSDILMRPEPILGCGVKTLNFITGGYLEPLSPEVQKRILDRAGMSEAPDLKLGEKIFWKAWPHIKREAVPYARMDAFLRLYGFCRNLSFVSLIAAIVFWFRPPNFSELPTNSFTWLGAAIISLVLFQRYLKFFRAYGLELLTTYAEPPVKSPDT